MWSYSKSATAGEVLVDVLQVGPTQLPADVRTIIATRLFQIPKEQLVSVSSSGTDFGIQNMSLFEGGGSPPPSPIAAPPATPDEPAKA